MENSSTFVKIGLVFTLKERWIFHGHALRITNLRALGSHKKGGVVGNAIIPDKKKHQDDESGRKSFSNQRKITYLVNSIFEAWEMLRSRPDINVVATVIWPRSVVSE